MDGGDIVLKVGQVSPQLSVLMVGRQLTSAAFITAFNPYSSIASGQENELNHRALLADVSALGLDFIAGEARDGQKVWPSESSILVLGISLYDAELLARRYKQNAFVWISSDDDVVNLHLLFPISAPAEINSTSNLVAPGSTGSH